MLKYGAEFFKKIRATLFFRKDKPVPIDSVMDKTLHFSLTRMMLYDFDKVRGRNELARQGVH